MLGEQLDGKVQNKVQVLTQWWNTDGSSIVMAADEALIRAHDRTLLAKHGGHIQITESWAMSLLKRMGYVVAEKDGRC